MKKPTPCPMVPRPFRGTALAVLAMLCLSAVAAVRAADQPAVAASEGRDLKVYVLPLRGAIDQGLMILYRRAFRELEAVRPDLLIIEIDTPGGRLLETEEIIAWMRAAETPIYAFVNYHAQSAGAIVSFGADKIFMAPGSRIGSALPVIMTPGGVAEIPDNVYEKILSDTRALVRGVAQSKGHWEEIAVAMVDPSYEVKVNDRVISKAGELLNLTAQEAVEIIPPRQRPVLAEAIVEDIPALLEYLGMAEAEVVYIEQQPAETLARWIILIGPLLFALGILGIYIEMRSPGIGLPGLAGAVCLAIYFFGHHVGGLAGIEDIALILLGLVLIAVEIFVIPGFGITGLLGLASIAIGLIMSLVPRLPALPDELPGISTPSLVDYLPMISMRLIMVVVLTGMGMWLLARLLPKASFYGKLVLQKTLDADTGYTSADIGYRDYLGRTGVAMTALRPSGTAVFDDLRLDVVSSGDMISRGSRVKIIQVEGNRIIVEQIEPSEEEGGAQPV